MKKFKKIKLFSIKKPKYLDLLIKYNSVVNELQTLQDVVKDNVAEVIYDRIFKETEQLDYYKEQNKRLRAKVKELKQALKLKN